MNFNRPLILASKSPRRQQLLKEAGFHFSIITKEVDESYPDDLPATDVAAYLSRKKADAFIDDLEDSVLITADTTVKVDTEILNKPANYKEAEKMLETLSGRSHEVITGFTIKDRFKQITRTQVTRVSFKTLSEEEIAYYISRFEPYDKAGSYGIQEWIGMIGIERIEGCYFNVVGLPIHSVYVELEAFN